MNTFIKKVLIKLGHPLIKKLGYISLDTLRRKEKKQTMLGSMFQKLVDQNFKPNHIIDIGANHGVWTREALEYFPDAEYSLFEPQAWLRESSEDLLKNPKVHFNSVGVGGVSGSFKFTISDRDDSSTFMFSEQEAKEKGFKQIDVPIVTLNEFIPENHLPVPDIIKIDAEGIDIEVLKGASSYFGKTELIFVEASVNNKKFDNSFLTVINYMDKNGYSLFEITQLNRPFKSKVLWLVELAFVRKNGILDSVNWKS